MSTAGAGPQLPPDSTGKVVAAFSYGSGPTIYLPGTGLCDASGNLLIGQAAMTGSVPVVIASNQSAVTIQDGGGAISVDDNSGSLTVDNGGTFAVQAKLIDTGGTNQASISAGGAVKVDGSAVTQPVSAASLPLPSGAATAAKQPALGTAGSASSDVISVQGVASMTALKVDPSAVTSPVSLAGQTSGGLSVSRLLAANSTNATSVKGSAGQVFGWYLFNSAAYTVFFKLYNKASSPTVGTDTPFMTIGVPAGGGANVFSDIGVAMGTGVAFAVTKLIGDSDTTVVAANDLAVNLFYK